MKPVDITQDDIENVVRVFYARIRRHEVLGPIFLDQIPDTGDNWPAHETKIGAFWSSAILGTRTFRGNPMRTHLQVPAIQPRHFELWLNLFDETLRDCLTSDNAQAFSSLAHRIGRSLRMGIEDARKGFGT